eukprot:8389376-Pyramimonas_sp.AAC.1
MRGFAHALCTWWLYFKGALAKLGLEAAEREPCVWVARDDGNVVGRAMRRLDVTMTAESHFNAALQN